MVPGGSGEPRHARAHPPLPGALSSEHGGAALVAAREKSSATTWPAQRGAGFAREVVLTRPRREDVAQQRVGQGQLVVLVGESKTARQAASPRTRQVVL